MINKIGLKQFYLEREAHNLTIEAYQRLASEVRSYLGELIHIAEVAELNTGTTLKSLKGLYKLASDNFDIEAANREIKAKSSIEGSGRYEALPKEVCELLDYLIDDFDNGVIEQDQIKCRLEDIQIISEAYYEHLEGRKYDEIIK